MLLFSRLENFNLLLGNLPKLFKFSPVSFFNYTIYFLYNIFKDAISQTIIKTYIIVYSAILLKKETCRQHILESELVFFRSLNA